MHPREIVYFIFSHCGLDSPLGVRGKVWEKRKNEMHPREIVIISLLIFLFAYIPGNSQKQYFYPVKYKIRLSGFFGELRKNHFHSGIDIKSSGSYELNKVYSIDEGYISRIRVGPDGYGKAVYIDHPDGITSVYAHLKHFSKKLEAIVKKIQYESQSYSINPDSLKIPVKKGEFIGQIGNTGRSFGPHLHFELRNTETEHPLNPFVFGIKPRDRRPPRLLNLKIVALDTAFNELNSKIYHLQKSKYGNYIPKPFTIKYGAWRVGIEVSGFDRMNNAPNKNGIYKMSMKVDGKEVFGFKMDSLDFDNMRSINSFIDYKTFVRSKARFIRLYKLPGNDLNILNDTLNSIINLYKDKSQKIEIIAQDFEGNKSKLIFKIKRDTAIKEPEPKLFNDIIKFGQQKQIGTLDYTLFFDRNDLFKDLYIFSNIEYDSIENYSGKVKVFTNYDPFKSHVDLFIRPLKIDSFADKMTIVKIEDDKKINYGSDIKGDRLHTIIDTWGIYKIDLDTIAPVIKPVKFGANLEKIKSISFRIKDNFEVAGLASGLKYDGYIDDKWVLFEYDKKKDIIKHRFEKKLRKGQHRLKIIVEDDKGNKTIFKSKFNK